MLGAEQECDVSGCRRNADAYGDGHQCIIHIPSYFSVKVWLCSIHFRVWCGETKPTKRFKRVKK